MKKLYLILFFALSILSLNAKTKTKAEGQVCKHYSVEWQGLHITEMRDGRPLHNELYVFEYDSKNKYLQTHQIDTVYTGNKVQFVSHEKAAYVVVCLVQTIIGKEDSSPSVPIPAWYPLFKLDADSLDFVITKEMIGALFPNQQKLNKKGDVVTKKDGPKVIQ